MEAQAPAAPAKPVFAAFGNRTAALLLDVILLGFAAGAVSEFVPGGYAFVVFAFLYFTLLPLSPLQGTFGKWICRIRLCDREGKPVTWRASALRAGAMLAWCTAPQLLHQLPITGEVPSSTMVSWWWTIAFLPWCTVEIAPRGETLFDRVAGTLVVRLKADAESVVRAEPRKSGIFKAGANVLLFLIIGGTISMSFLAQRDHNLRFRTHYAYSETANLRQAVEEFRDRENRWPSAQDLGVPEWKPYPDGGGYRLMPDGSIVISFSVLPELKGHRITLRPIQPEGTRKVQWICSSDEGSFRRYVMSHCRQSAP